MNLKYRIIRIPLSKEEKLARVSRYISDTGSPVDIDAFVNKDVFDEYVEMKCLNCGHEETLDFDMLQEMMQLYDTDYPEDFCPKCDHGMVPKDLYFQFKKLFK